MSPLCNVHLKLLFILHLKPPIERFLLQTEISGTLNSLYLIFVFSFLYFFSRSLLVVRISNFFYNLTLRNYEGVLLRISSDRDPLIEWGQKSKPKRLNVHENSLVNKT